MCGRTNQSRLPLLPLSTAQSLSRLTRICRGIKELRKSASCGAEKERLEPRTCKVESIWNFLSTTSSKGVFSFGRKGRSSYVKKSSALRQYDRWRNPQSVGLMRRKRSVQFQLLLFRKQKDLQILITILQYFVAITWHRHWRELSLRPKSSLKLKVLLLTQSIP